MRVHRSLLAALVALLLSLTSLQAGAQDSIPHPQPRVPTDTDAPVTVERTDLAAIALTAADLPRDYALGFEAYLGGDDVASQLFGGEIPDAEIEEIGLLWYYESQYEAADGLSRIRTYIEQYEDEAAVERGFELLEDEDRSSGAGVTTEDLPGLDGIGEEPSEVTIFTFDDTDANTIDATFRVGNLLLGIAIDSLSGNEPDEDLLLELAERLEERADAVLANDALAGIDSRLPGSMLTFGDALVIQEGYLTLEEGGGAAASDAAQSTFASAYIRMVVLGMDIDPDLPLPFVSIAVTSFSSESGALAYLSDIEDLTPAYAELDRVRIDRISGTSAAVALSYANPYDTDGPDSFIVAVAIDASVLVIEVVGAASLDEARETTLSLIDQQVPCLTDASACGTAVLPAGFEAAQG